MKSVSLNYEAIFCYLNSEFFLKFMVGMLREYILAYKTIER